MGLPVQFVCASESQWTQNPGWTKVLQNKSHGDLVRKQVNMQQFRTKVENGSEK